MSLAFIACEPNEMLANRLTVKVNLSNEKYELGIIETLLCEGIIELINK